MSVKQFISSYSGGKDSVLAFSTAIDLGMAPAGLLTTYNPRDDRSFFHGIPKALLEQAAKSLGMPLYLVCTDGGRYGADFEQALEALGRQGVTTAVFGDIDIEEHRRWCTDRCNAVGMEAAFPLWNQSRGELVGRFIDQGYKAVITTVNTQMMPARFLGEILTRQLVQEIEAGGADGCGENGEYHTFTFNGPVFIAPVPYQLGRKITRGSYEILPLS